MDSAHQSQSLSTSKPWKNHGVGQIDITLPSKCYGPLFEWTRWRHFSVHLPKWACWPEPPHPMLHNQRPRTTGAIQSQMRLGCILMMMRKMKMTMGDRYQVVHQVQCLKLSLPRSVVFHLFLYWSFYRTSLPSQSLSTCWTNLSTQVSACSLPLSLHAQPPRPANTCRNQRFAFVWRWNQCLSLCCCSILRTKWSMWSRWPILWVNFLSTIFPWAWMLWYHFCGSWQVTSRHEGHGNCSSSPLLFISLLSTNLFMCTYQLVHPWWGAWLWYWHVDCAVGAQPAGTTHGWGHWHWRHCLRCSSFTSLWFFMASWQL